MKKKKLVVLSGRQPRPQISKAEWTRYIEQCAILREGETELQKLSAVLQDLREIVVERTAEIQTKLAQGWEIEANGRVA